jgi:chromosome segregation ATPase
VDNAFDLLEQRVRRAADALRRLQAENADLRKQLSKAQGALAQAEKALEKQGPAADPREAERHLAQARELAALQRDREELRQRIGRLVEALEGLDG